MNIAERAQHTYMVETEQVTKEQLYAVPGIISVTALRPKLFLVVLDPLSKTEAVLAGIRALVEEAEEEPPCSA